MRYLLAEFIGTFFVCLAVLSGAGPLAVAAALAVAMYGPGAVSGGHCNPAVSLAAWLRGGFDRREMLRYFGAQFAGAAVAVLVVAAGVGAVAVDSAGGAVPVWRALVAECLFTFLLALTFLQVAGPDGRRRHPASGAAAGACVYVGTVLSPGIPVAAFNPAAGGAVVLAGDVPAAMLVVYLSACAAGGALAAVAFRVLNPDD